MQDSNGNQIFIRYLQGANAFWGDSSARIYQIEDVRATSYFPNIYRTYDFSYNTDSPVPHCFPCCC